MTFDDFKREIKHYLVMADITSDPRFWIDREKGMFVCDIKSEGGYRLTANSISDVITVLSGKRKFAFEPRYIALWRNLK